MITDHLMPGMSGSEFVRALRRTHPTLPVLVISGLEEAEQEYTGLNVTVPDEAAAAGPSAGGCGAAGWWDRLLIVGGVLVIG